MIETLTQFIVSHPILAASLSSVWGAVLVDLLAFKSSKEPGDFLGQFSWKVAGLRYLQAFVGGFIGNTITAGVIVGAGAVGLVLWSVIR